MDQTKTDQGTNPSVPRNQSNNPQTPTDQATDDPDGPVNIDPDEPGNKQPAGPSPQPQRTSQHRPMDLHATPTGHSNKPGNTYHTTLTDRSTNTR
jgi:hypothetical protein